ncbi:ABC transporter substrate-binding protein [Spirochaetia bacterium]|nr:ABC transporter substrate-binding protein [Spirochaetia bacterium]
MKRIFVVLAAALLVALVFFGCSKKADSKYPLGAYDIAYSGSTCGSPVTIAKLNGYFDEEGINITLVSGSTFEAERSALAAGKNIISNGDFQYFPAVQNGIDVKLIGGLHEGCIKLLVPVDSPITTLEDLRGKTIAVDEIGGTPMSVASVVAGSVGIDPQTEISWKPFPGDLIIQSLEKGEADVVSAWDPFATMAENTGKYRVLVDISDHPLFAGKACCFLFGAGKVIQENPAAVAGVLRAINKATEWIGAHPEEAAQKLVEEKLIATDEVELVAGLLDHYKYGNHSGHAANIRAKDDAVYFADWLTRIGYLPADLDPQQFVDDLYVDIAAVADAAGKK